MVVSTLDTSSTLKVADKLGLHVKKVEITCLDNGIVPTRYLRNQESVKPDDQIRLLNAKVAVIGLGGLGGLVVETLARIGVGHLTLVDGDVFEDHNLNRQLMSTHSAIGLSKALTAAKRVNEVNTAVQVVIHDSFMTAENAATLVNDCDVVVDCLDNINTRFDLEKAAKRIGIPMVSAAIAGVTGHVTTIFPEDTGLALIYGSRQTIRETKGAETILGCLPQAVFLISAVESSEVIKLILGQPQGLLRNKLWVVDLTNNTFEVLSLN